MTTNDNYSTVPGVRVSTSEDVRVNTAIGPDMTEHEYQLTTILILMTLDTGQPRDAYIGVDIDAVAQALQCFDYGPYETRPMVWTTLGEIGERYY